MFDSLLPLYILDTRLAAVFIGKLSSFIISNIDLPWVPLVAGLSNESVGAAVGTLAGGGGLGAADALGPPGGARGAAAGALPLDAYYTGA